MMFDQADRNPSGQVVLYDRKTGQRFERWAVDAREMLLQYSETYTIDAGECEQPAQESTSVIPQQEAPRELPTEHSPGVPLRAVKSSDAPPAQPLSAPVRSTRDKGER